MFNAQEKTQTWHEFQEMTSVASRLIQEVTAHAQRDSLEDAREIWVKGTYIRNNLRIT